MGRWNNEGTFYFELDTLELTFNNKKSKASQVREYYEKNADKQRMNSWSLCFDKGTKVHETKLFNFGKVKDEVTTTYVGETIEEFLVFLMEQKKSWKLYSPNFRKREASFIIKKLRLLGFTKLEIGDKVNCRSYTQGVNDGKIYWIKLFIPGKEKGKFNTITFEDNSLMFDLTIEEMAKQCGIKEGNPAWILNRFRKHMSDELSEYGYPRTTWERTQGMTAVKSWRDILGGSLLDKTNTQTCTWSGGKKSVKFKGKWYDESAFKDMVIDNLLPTEWLKGKGVFNKVYKWYSGGIAKVNEDYRGRIVDNMYVVDVVSSYPSIMASDLECPWGNPVSEEEGTFHLYEVSILRDLNNDSGLPFVNVPLQLDKLTSEHRRGLKRGLKVYLTSVEYERFEMYYGVKEGDVKVKTIYSFKTKPFSKIFGDYVNKWYELKDKSKKEGNAFVKQFAKVMLNSLYGKFATKRDREVTKYINGKYLKTIETSDMIMYLPIAIAITAYGRMKLVDAVGMDYKGFVYCDTDSLFVKDWLLNKMIFEGRITLGSELGNWELDCYEPYKALVRRTKEYLCIGTQQRKLAFAGINLEADKDYLNFEDFIYGKEIHGQKTPVELDWGVVYYEADKNIKPIWDYPPLKEQTKITKEDYLGAN